MGAGRHTQYQELVCTTAPLCVEMVGRDPSRENSVIVGTYVLNGTVSHRPSYLNAAAGYWIYWARTGRRWVIGHESGSETCTAFASTSGAGEHPAEGMGRWKVYEGARGIHLE